MVTLAEQGQPSRRIIAKADIGGAGGDWSMPELAGRVQRQLRRVAGTGASNTE